MPEVTDLEQLKTDVSATKRATQAQRRNLVLIQRRPQPPRGVAVQGGQLAWEEPRERRNITQYRIYAPDDQELFTSVPVGSRRLNGMLPSATRIYVSSFNENSGLESRRVLAETEVIPGSFSAPPASNVLDATAATIYRRGEYGFSGVITLPVEDPFYVEPTRITVIFIGPDGSTQELEVATLTSGTIYGNTTVNYTGFVGLLDGSTHTGTLRFDCIDANGNVTPGGLTVPVSIAAAIASGEVASVTGREVPDSITADPVSRLVSTIIGAVPSFADEVYPRDAAYFVSQDNGVTFNYVGWQSFTTAGQEVKFARVKPTTDQTWKVAMVARAAVGDPSIWIAAEDLPTGTVISAGFPVGALEVPPDNLITDVTVGAGSGDENFPYNVETSDGVQYYSIPSFTLDTSAAALNPNVWTVNMTFQDIGADGTPVGPEHINGTVVPEPITPTTDGLITLGRLIGDYGRNGYSYERSANIAAVRIKVVCSNRVDQTTSAWANTLASTYQNLRTIGYIDVVVAVGGITPGTKLNAQHPGNVTIGTPTYEDIGAGQYRLHVPYAAPPDDPVFSGVLAEVEMPDQSGPLKADGTTPWDGTKPLVGESRPLTFGPIAYDASDPQVSLAVPKPSTTETIRIRLRSASADVINDAAGSPSVTLELPAGTGANTSSGSAYTACATWGYPPATVGKPYNLNGKLEQDIEFTGIVAPDDIRFAGWEIWSSGWPDDPSFYPESAIQSPTSTRTAITVAVPTKRINVAFWLVSLSIDERGSVQRNPIVAGVTPSTTVVLGTTSGTIDLSSVLTGSFDEDEFHRDPETGIFSSLKINAIKLRNLSSQFEVIGNLQRVTNLSADLLITGRLQVGGGTNKVSQVRIFNAAGSGLVGWIGDDTGNSGYQGAWFKQVLIGGSSPANAQLSADVNGNVTMAGDLITSGSLKVGGGGGKPGKLNVFDHLGDSVGWIGDDFANSGFSGAWFKQLLVGGANPSLAKLVADQFGNLAIAGDAVFGNISGNAANITGTLLVTQIGDGTLPVGVVYAGRVACSQLDAGVINATIRMTSPELDISSGTMELKVDAANGVKYSNTDVIVQIDQASDGFGFSGLRLSRTADGYAVTARPDGMAMVSGSVVVAPWCTVTPFEIRLELPAIPGVRTRSYVSITAAGVNINGRNV